MFYEFQPYDRIVSLLRRMSNLEKLTLNISIKDRNSVIDGTYVQHDIFDCMPQLHLFTFYICTYVETIDLSYKLSSEDIQQTLTNIGLQNVISIVNYVCDSRAACSIFSLPFQFDYLKDLGNKFLNIVFSYVTYLHVKDNDPFRHEFLVRIVRSFPLLKYLRIYNVRSSLPIDLMTFSSDNCQLYSTIEYSHLTTLDLSYAHREYVEQFLNETKTYMPCLTELLVMNKLSNLKCFSLKMFYEFQPYDRIASLFRRMSNLEKLTLNISIKDRNSVIDGTYIQHDIFDCMPQLHSFTFYICTYVETVDLSYKLSSEDIQQTLMNIGLQDVTSIVNYVCDSRAACSIFSLPFQFEYLKDLGNKFPNIVFSYVTYLHVKDNDPFRHEFFVRIAQSFPLLKYLRIYNVRSSLPVDLMTFSSDNCQLYSTIEYPQSNYT
ncbi:unnamed protein product [Rotaria sp. Silwood2]|nr:unnamed protein product [Rotaria sp. Silwood2]